MMIFLLSLLIINHSFALDEVLLCSKWNDAIKLGVLGNDLEEASGLAVSSQFPDTFYHINDSGDGPFFYKTNSNGELLSKIKIQDFQANDVESLGYGKCPQSPEDKCIVLADIGDNATMRDSVKILFIKEKEFTSQKIVPESILTVSYPDRSHNAEGIALHPTGDLYLITKEIHFLTKNVAPAILFRIKSKDLLKTNKNKLIFEKIGEWDFPTLLRDYDNFGKIITGFDIHPSGKKLILLTYSAILEVSMDLSQKFLPTTEWKLGLNYHLVQTPKVLPQQESLSYSTDGKGIYFSTESSKKHQASLWQMTCQ